MKNKSRVLLLAGVALLLVYELYALKTAAPGDTISEIVWRLSSRPLVPFAFGLLMGHFFWQSSRLQGLEPMKVRWTQRAVQAAAAGDFSRANLAQSVVTELTNL